jgi:hypothetical protein
MSMRSPPFFAAAAPIIAGDRRGGRGRQMGTLGVCERGIFFASGKNWVWVWVLGLGKGKWRLIGEVAAAIGITITAPKLELNFHRKIGSPIPVII